MLSKSRSSQVRGAWLVAVAFISICAASARGQGLIMPGVGPVNRGMSGVATAAPIDAAGTIFRNPAGMNSMASSEVTFGVELLLQTETLSSSWPIGPISGSTNGEPGASVIPTAAIVHRDDHSPWAFGLGMYGVAGFKTNYPASLTNPALMPQPIGLGRVFSELQVMEVAPAVSYALTPQFSIGVSPILAVATLSADPLVLAAPDDADGDTFPTYPHGLGARYHYGGGVQVGLFYTATQNLRFGFSVKSPTWFEDFRFFTEDETGAPRLETLNFDLPMVVSLGVSYVAWERLLWAMDVRYFDYRNTAGFRTAAYNADGSATGLGWKNIMSVSTALQYDFTPWLTGRVGYHYQQNPISSANTFINVASPLLIGHIASVGATIRFNESVAANIAYLHGFEGSNTGPFVLPGVGAVPGSSITSAISADALTAGVTVKY